LRYEIFFDELYLTWVYFYKGDIPFPRFSHTMVFEHETLFLHGGLDAEKNVLSDLFRLEIIDGLVKSEKIECISPALFSHTSGVIEIQGDRYMLVIGGCSQLCNSDAYFFNIEKKCWQKSALFKSSSTKVKHGMVCLKNNRVWIFGGGLLCFSFGTHFDSCFSLSFQGKEEVKKLEAKQNSNNGVKQKTTNEKKEGRKIAIFQNPSEDDILSDIYSARKPVILRNCDIGKCTELRKDQDYLKKKCGDKQVSVRFSSHKKLNFIEKNFKFSTISFSKLVEMTLEEKGPPATW